MRNDMIWCVEDDVSIRDIEVYTLEQTGFIAKGFGDGDIQNVVTAMLESISMDRKIRRSSNPE